MITNFKMLAASLALTLSTLALAQPDQVTGTIISITGQRAQVRLTDGSTRWFSIRKADAALTQADLGKKIAGVTTHVGDAEMLSELVLSK